MRGAVILAIILLGGCQSETTFDERYDTAQETIEAKAKELDAELKDAPPAGEDTPEDGSAD
ncbi:MAG: hypothetical protein MK010_10880 [Erythrobacter sp.]|nr:hypothetical protein [Erythrobacter sp.]